MKKLVKELFIPGIIVVSMVAMTFMATFSDDIKTTAAVMAPSVYKSDVTLVIDPGHGGADGGAVSDSGAKESEINLAIALKIRDLAGFFGVDTIMTRQSEEIPYPESAGTIREKKVYDQNSRVDLVNSTENAILISVHQNNYPDASPSGGQIFYTENNCSIVLAGNIQEVFASAISPESTRAASVIGDDIYLFQKIDCPAVLVECGFMSNPGDFALLSTESYRSKLALVIISGYMQSEDDINSYYGGTNESKDSILLY